MVLAGAGCEGGLHIARALSGEHPSTVALGQGAAVIGGIAGLGNGSAVVDVKVRAGFNECATVDLVADSGNRAVATSPGAWTGQ